MATVTHLSNEIISWLETNGSDVKFLISASIHFVTGEKCKYVGHSPHFNNNFPIETPELHVDIENDPINGENPLDISKEITVNMSDINDFMVAKLLIKETGTTKKQEVYQETAGTFQRG